ncbi:hypothetical protein CY35_05G103400 [Sphagnum magellanicum]|nr:hypothetical protein CY35_05G103400 [Sphagnum magellanicum]KAH9563025.1 hypothetical protein CY35_05G103400 [Sphagnum magellanicum]
MGNCLKRGYKAISLRDLRASKSLSHQHTPANRQDEKPKAFMKIEEEDQLDEILDAIEQALKKFQPGTDQRAPAQYLGIICSGFNDAASVMSTLSQNCESLNSQLTINNLSAECFTLLCDVLKGASKLRWAGAALSFVVYVLEQVDQRSKNTSECLSLLHAMRDLAKHIRALLPQLPEADEKLKTATSLIAQGTVLCCTHVKSGTFSKLCFAGSTKESMDQLRKMLEGVYPNLTLTAVEKVLERTSKLTRQISLPLSPSIPVYPSGKVGLDERVDMVIKRLEMEDSEMRAVVLHGMGGIGKSTLGDGVYAKLNSKKGRNYCKVEVGESPSLDTLRNLQANIMERLSGQKVRLGDHREGLQFLRQFLGNECQEPLFIFIDNVLNAEVLTDLLPEKLILPKHSRVLVTSRDANARPVLEEMGFKCSMYEVEELDLRQARRLLCLHAFGGKEAAEAEAAAEKQNNFVSILSLCAGLPLALEVVGKYLKSRNWDSASKHVVDSLQSCDPLTGNKENRLYRSLEFSYAQLAKANAKAFLDITAFLVDLPWEMVSHVIGEGRLKALEELALIKQKLDVDNVTRVHVHDLLIALGRNKETGIRVWSDGAVWLPPALKEDETDMKKIEGLSLRNCKEALPAETLDVLCKSLRVLILENEVIGQCRNSPYQLQLLIIKGAMPFQNLWELSQLAVLSISEVDMDFKDFEFPRELKALSLECKKLRELPTNFQDLHSLHTLDLRFCYNLERLPAGFGQLSSLQTLELGSCKRLKELPDDFGKLQALQYLDLGGCENLTELVPSFGWLHKLQKLELWQCKSLRKLPDNFGQLLSLCELNLHGCESLQSLPDSFGQLSNLNNLSLASCSRLTKLPDNFGSLNSLLELKLTDCISLKEFPESFNQLTTLQLVHINENNSQIVQELVDCHFIINHDLPYDISSLFDESTPYDISSLFDESTPYDISSLFDESEYDYFPDAENSSLVLL